MPIEFIVLILAAVLTAAAAVFVLRAVRRAPGGAEMKAAPVFLVAAIAGVSALGLYLVIGRPDLPDAPYQARLEALRDRDPTTFSFEEALAILHEAARDNPRDAQPHLFSGQLYLDSGRPEEAARAFDAALRRAPGSAEAMMGLGRAMVQIDEGRVSPEALRLFQQAASLTNDPAPWMYQALAAIGAGDDAAARRYWNEAQSRMAPDDPRRAMAAPFGSTP